MRWWGAPVSRYDRLKGFCCMKMESFIERTVESAFVSEIEELDARLKLEENLATLGSYLFQLPTLDGH